MNPRLYSIDAREYRSQVFTRAFLRLTLVVLVLEIETFLYWIKWQPSDFGKKIWGERRGKEKKKLHFSLRKMLEIPIFSSAARIRTVDDQKRHF